MFRFSASRLAATGSQKVAHHFSTHFRRIKTPSVAIWGNIFVLGNIFGFSSFYPIGPLLALLSACAREMSVECNTLLHSTLKSLNFMSRPCGVKKFIALHDHQGSNRGPIKVHPSPAHPTPKLHKTGRKFMFMAFW